MSYSIKVAQRNAVADENLLGVQLGRLCIRYDIPVTVVMRDLNVSKCTVYKWFSGAADVNKHLRGPVEAYSRRLADFQPKPVESRGWGVTPR